MHQGLGLFPLLILLCVKYTEANNTPCNKEAKFLANLIMAKESISKAKLLYPTDGNLNSSNCSCGIKDKAFGYLDVAMDLISYSLNIYPSCSDNIENEHTNPEKKPLKYEHPVDCSQVLENGYNASGVYTIWLKNGNTSKRSVEVFCDMITEGGGWIVIQRRGDFSEQEDFFQNWAAYKKGFGSITKDFWIGNDNIYAITNGGNYSMRIDLEDTDGLKGYATYDSFWIEDESSNYKLHIGKYSGNVGDSMKNEHGKMFSTRDRKNNSVSRNCGNEYEGGWWYWNCAYANLNGVYKENSVSGVYWYHWKNKVDPLRAVEMKLKKI